VDGQSDHGDAQTRGGSPGCVTEKERGEKMRQREESGMDQKWAALAYVVDGGDQNTVAAPWTAARNFSAA